MLHLFSTRCLWKTIDTQKTSHYTFIIEHFEGWLKDLKKTGGYWAIVERHDYNWSNIYSDLNRLFKDEVWNQVLEQRARERDQYNDRVNTVKSTERRTDHI